MHVVFSREDHDGGRGLSRSPKSGVDRQNREPDFGESGIDRQNRIPISAKSPKSGVDRQNRDSRKMMESYLTNTPNNFKKFAQNSKSRDFAKCPV